MGKIRKEIQKAYRERKGEELRRKERERSKLGRLNKTVMEKKLERVQGNARMSNLRERRREAKIDDENNTPETPFRQRSTECRALKRVKRSLPSSPQKRKHVIKKLVAELGIQKLKFKRQCISQETIELVKTFFEREDVSRWTPGRKEYIKVNKQQMQKRYLLCPLVVYILVYM